MNRFRTTTCTIVQARQRFRMAASSGAWSLVSSANLASASSQDFDLTPGNRYWLRLRGMTSTSTAYVDPIVLSDGSTIGSHHNYSLSARRGPTYGSQASSANLAANFRWGSHGIAKSSGVTTTATIGTNMDVLFEVGGSGNRLSGSVEMFGELFLSPDNAMSCGMEYAAFGVSNGTHDADGIRVALSTGVWAAGTAELRRAA